MTATERLRNWRRATFTTDLRSLTLFRLALATALCVDLARRLPELTAFFTDDGVFPRSVLSGAAGWWRVSAHAANGQLWFQALLFAVALIAALALLVGWQTRRAQLVSWLLYVSMLNRAPDLVGGGQMLLAALLFWSLFLPVHALWSVDAAWSDAAPARGYDSGYAVTGWASCGLLLQVALALLMISLSLPTGRPLAALLARHDEIGPAGLWLQAHAGLQHLAGAVVRGVGIAAPILLFAPLRMLRRLALIALALIQIAALAILARALLPWIALSALIPFIDGRLWRRRSPAPPPLRIYHDRDRPHSEGIHRLLKTFLILPSAELRTAQDEARTATLFRANGSWIVIDDAQRAHMRCDALIVLMKHSPLLGGLGALLSRLPIARIGDAGYRLMLRGRGGRRPFTPRALRFDRSRADRLVPPLLALLLIWNLGVAGGSTVAVSGISTPLARLLRLDQNWPGALPGADANGDGWFVAPGLLADHRQVDLLRASQAPDFNAPAVLARRQLPMDWQRYLNRLRGPGAAHARARYADFLCRRWNRSHTGSARLLGLKLIFLLEPQNQGDDVEQHVLWRQDCGSMASNP